MLNFMATMREIMKRRWENKKAAAKRVYFISTPQSKGNPLYDKYLDDGKNIILLEQGVGKSSSILKDIAENERWARICADNKDVADSFDRIAKEQQWYLPQVINDTEGDAEVIPFPKKENPS